MTANDTDATTGPPQAESEQERVYRPKPPLWRPARERRRSTLQIVLIGLGITAVGCALGVLALESLLFSGPAEATPVTITAVETAAHAGENSPGHFVYRVRLPDGSHARFESPRTHRVGTRPRARVSKGRITGRTFVMSPYAVLPDE